MVINSQFWEMDKFESVVRYKAHLQVMKWWLWLCKCEKVAIVRYTIASVRYKVTLWDNYKKLWGDYN